MAPDAPRWVTAALAAAAILIPLGALLGKELQHVQNMPTMWRF